MIVQPVPDRARSSCPKINGGKDAAMWVFGVVSSWSRSGGRTISRSSVDHTFAEGRSLETAAALNRSDGESW